MKRGIVAAVIVLLSLTHVPVFAGLPSAAVEIQNEADYVRLKQAACASQVVLTDLQRSPNNRVVGVLAGIMQAAAENRNMTASSLQAFAVAFDSYLQNPTEPTHAHSGDTNLLVPANFITAVRFGVHKAKQPGMTADFGLEILQMLGISNAGSTTQEEAMIKFLDSQALDLVNDGNTNIMLTYGFMGLDASGNPSAGVRATFVQYLISQGLNPFPTPSVLASNYPGVAAAMAALPADYAGMQADRANSFAAMQSSVIGQAGTLVDSLPVMIYRAVVLDSTQRLDYIAALSNPNQAYIDAVRAQRMQDLEQLNRARSEMNAKLSVMKIAGGESTADKVGAVVEYVGAAAKIVSGVASIALAIMVPSPPTIIAGICGFADIVGGGCQIFNASAAKDKLTIEDLNNQIIEMRQQMQEIQTQLNHRFNAVDASLDQILLQLGDVTLQLNSIRDGVYELQSDLDRMNQRLFGAFLLDYQQPFFTTINSALGYKSAHFGYDMTFMTETESWSVFENDMQIQASQVADDLAGPQVCGLTAGDADTYLERDNYSYNVNDLRQFPSASGWWPSYLHPSRIANPTVWATAANAYAELAHANPWYHAMYRANPMSGSRLDDVRVIGEDIQHVLKDFGNRPFISALVQRHREAQAAFVDVANGVRLDLLNEQFGTTKKTGVDLALLDIWADPTQRVAGWPNAQARIYRTDLETYSEGAYLNSDFPIDSRFLQSGALANQHNLGKGTLSVRLVGTWVDKRYVLKFPGLTYDCYARPLTVMLVFHHDNSTGDDQLVYWCNAISGTEIYVWWIDSWAPKDDNPLWVNSVEQRIYLENWTTGQNLYTKTLNTLSNQTTNNQPRIDAVTQSLNNLFDGLQTEFYNRMLQQLDTPGSAVANAAKNFSSLQALLEAYVSLAYPQSMKDNQLLHGILRGSNYQFTDSVVRRGSMSIGADAIRQVYLGVATTPPAANPDIEAIFGARLDALQAQLDTIALPDALVSNEIHPFLKYALANITDAGVTTTQLANDDQYVDTADEPGLIVPASLGVLVNDAPCPNVLNQDYAYEVDALFVGATQPGGQQTTTQGGTVTFDADGRGGFTYTAPAGFSGIDMFQYKARGQFVASPTPLLSNMATVYISVVSGPGILAQPQPVTVFSGQPALMQVGVWSDLWQLTWRKNGIPLNDDGRALGTHTDRLVISAAELGDAGNYDVTFSLPGSPGFVSSSAALTVLPGSIPDVKRVADTVVADMAGCVVTRVWPDFFYVETPNRAAGIGVSKTGHGLSPGDVVALSGSIYTDGDEERCIFAGPTAKLGTGSVEPLGMTSCAIGGSDAFNDFGNGQHGITNGTGLNNVGLLIRACGTVTYTDPGGFFFDIWDGATYGGILPNDPEGAEGIRVSAAGMTLPSPGDFVVVTGISSLRQYDSTVLPEILVNDETDIQTQVNAGEMIFIPAGSFQMGNSNVGNDATYGQPDESPQHSVYLSAYRIGKH